MSFRAAKQVAPITATTALLEINLKEREREKKTIIINKAVVWSQCAIDGSRPRLQEKENEKDFFIFISFGG